MKLSLQDFRQLSGVEILSHKLLRRANITGVSTDSRTVVKGNVFFALRGEKFDGHQFVLDVGAKKVVAVVVDRMWAESGQGISGLQEQVVITVPDTTKALGELARIYRRKFSIPVLAIAGSNGKTTTKEMISAVLQERYNVLSTEGNLNNHIGVPAMLFRLSPKHDIAVLELGTNHPGELKYLCDIVEPTHALITNIGKEHLEFFSNEEGVATEETELFRSLKPAGFAFINGDDQYVATAGKRLRRKMTYGKKRTADIRVTNAAPDEFGRFTFTIAQKGRKRSEPVRLAVAGEHNVANALAAAAVGIKFKVSSKEVRRALKKFKAVNKRMETISRNGIIILNDTYNANPDSVIAALQTLKSLRVNGKKIVVLADMLELGEQTEHEHAKIGLAVSDMDFEYLLTFGPLSRYTHEASKLAFAEHFDSKSALVDSLKGQLQPGDAVLVKGSRGMKMEEVVAQL
jgi:UDP-N-acetylmuramoyl-tripeptide--D-alanyl-D-alanine ligase